MSVVFKISRQILNTFDLAKFLISFLVSEYSAYVLVVLTVFATLEKICYVHQELKNRVWGYHSPYFVKRGDVGIYPSLGLSLPQSPVI